MLKPVFPPNLILERALPTWLITIGSIAAGVDLLLALWFLTGMLQ